MRSRYFLMTIVTGLYLTACSVPLPSPTAELIEGAVPTPETAVTQTQKPTSTSPPGPSSPETSRILWISSSADLFNRVLTVDPQNPDRLAYCVSDEIRVSNNAGLTWETIPTIGIKTVSEENGYSLYGGDSHSGSTCLSVTLDPNHPSTFYAVFTTAQEQMGAPPVFYMGFFTSDNGDTWQMVPVPESATIEDFGGFWNLGEDSVEVLFNSHRQLENPTVFKTKDGGETWEIGNLSCPFSGPCIRWGPAPSNIPGMGSPLPQGIFSSSDGSSSWAAIEPPVELRAPAPNQLVAFSDNQVAIVSGSIVMTDPSPINSALRISQDSGIRFQQVEIPSITTSNDYLNYFPGLQMLPDESFLSQEPETNNWFWFDPHIPIWCPVDTDVLPQIPRLLQSVDDRIWWINEAEDKADSISWSEIGCTES